MPVEKCPCGSGQRFKKCCGRFLGGKAKAAGPLELMRSRYSAYVTGEIGYIIKTTVAEKRAELDRAELLEWSRQRQWRSLEIIAHGMSGETEGSVEFVARYDYGGEKVVHHELSTFKKIDGVWLYEAGTFLE